MFKRFKFIYAFVLVGLMISNMHAMSDKNARLIKIAAPLLSGLSVGGAVHLYNQPKDWKYTVGSGVAAAALVCALTFAMIKKTPNYAFKEVRKVLKLVDSKIKDFSEKASTNLNRSDLEEFGGSRTSLSQAIFTLEQIQQYLNGDKQKEAYNSLICQIGQLFDVVNLKIGKSLEIIVDNDLKSLNSSNIPKPFDSMDWAVYLCDGFYSEIITSRVPSTKAQLFDLSARIKFKIAEIRYFYATRYSDLFALLPNAETPPLIAAQKNIEASITLLDSSKMLINGAKQEACENLLKEIEKCISDFENKISEIQKMDGYLRQLQSYFENKIRELESKNCSLSGHVSQLASANYQLTSQVSHLQWQVLNLLINRKKNYQKNY